LITARGGSKGIPLKNLVDVNGKPLIYYSINASSQSSVDETWVTTDSKEIADVSKKHEAKVLMRPDQLANDIIMPDDSLIHFADNEDFDILVFIQPTSPMIKKEYIDGAISMLLTDGYDSIFTAHKYHWLPEWLCVANTCTSVGWDVNARPRRQDIGQNIYIENGMFYITTRESLLETKLRYGGRIGMFEIPLLDSFQVDTQEDLDLIRKLI
jgi:CMP-N-acetylneuraminic acid synthetase